MTVDVPMNSETRTARNPADPKATTIHALSDKLLSDILQRAQSRPGIVATREALAARTTHLTCCLRNRRFRHAYHHPPPDPELVRVANELWQTSLARTDIPGELIEHPLWCRSREAEALYKDVARPPPCIHVCKRWRDLCRRSVKVALCGVRDRPPSSTEVLILAWDWFTDPVQDLKFLRDLTDLHTLVFWLTNTGGLLADDPTEATSSVPPPLPSQLRRLRHLAFIVPPRRYHDCENLRDVDFEGDSDAFFTQIASLEHLETLVLPRGLPIPGHSMALLVQYVTGPQKLVTLVADGELQYRACDAKNLDGVRCLHVRAKEQYGRPGWPHDEAEPWPKEPLEQLTALESLKLDSEYGSAYDFAQHGYELNKLSALSALTHLHLCHHVCIEPTLARIAGATALRSFTLDDCPIFRLPQGHRNPFAGLRDLTSLKLGTDEGLKAKDVVLLCSQTSLRSFELSVAPGQSVAALRNLTRLTSLVLRHATLARDDCAAIAACIALERLHLRYCEFTRPDALGLLSSLKELRELAVRASTKSALNNAALVRLKPAAVFPHLRHLELHCAAKTCATRLGLAALATPALTRLQHVEDLWLYGVAVTDAELSELRKLPQLRRLVMRGCTGWTRPGLMGLIGCPELLVVDVQDTDLDWQDVPMLPFTLVVDGDDDQDYELCGAGGDDEDDDDMEFDDDDDDGPPEAMVELLARLMQAHLGPSGHPRS